MLKLPHPHVIAWTAHSVGTDILGTIVSLYSTSTLQALGQGVGFWGGDPVYPCLEAAPHAGAVCKAHVLGQWLDVSSLSLLVNSAGTLLPMVVVPTLAPLADDHRKRLPLVTASSLISAVGATAYFLFPPEPTHAALAASAILLVVLNCTMGLLGVCMNAFLRTIAREEEIRRRAALLGRKTLNSDSTDAPSREISDETLIQTLEAQGVPADDAALERLPLLGRTRTEDEDHTPPEDKTLARMSGVGHGLGTLITLGGILLCGQFLEQRPNGLSSLYQVQGTIGVVAGTTSMVAVYFLPRASDPLQDNAAAGSPGVRTEGSAHLFDGWRRIGTVLRWKVIRALPSLYSFLLLLSLIADVEHTTSATVLSYMQGRLGAAPSVMSQISIYPLGIAGLVALCAPAFQSRIGISSKALLIVGGGVMGLDLLYGSLPLWTPHGGGGYTSIEVMKPVFAFQGLAYGLQPAYGRTLYAQMIPVGYESAFFSLYALANRTCSFTGPLLVAAITNLTGGFVWVWFVLGLTALLPVVIIAFGFSPAKGEEEGRRWLKEDQTQEAA